MKNLIKKSHKEMWEFIKHELIEMSSDKYTYNYPEINLLVEIVIGAAKDRDIDYFKSKSFSLHSKLLKLDSLFIVSLIKLAFKIEDSGEVWTKTTPREEQWVL